MDFTSRYAQTLRRLRTRSPNYVIVYGGGSLLLLAIMALSLSQGWYSFAVLAMTAFMILLYFFGASLWSNHILYDSNIIRDTLFELGHLTPRMTIVDINLGLPYFSAALSRRLTTGEVIAIDIYNPQLAPDRALARAHNRADRPQPDPRLSFRAGNINLLPLPDNSVRVVTMLQTVSELWQEGDRRTLLQEVNRILSPGGCLLLAERVRTPLNTVIAGPSGLRYQPSSYWLGLLNRSEFKVGSTQSIRELALCIRADKRDPGEVVPLQFDS